MNKVTSFKSHAVFKRVQSPGPVEVNTPIVRHSQKIMPTGRYVTT